MSKEAIVERMSTVKAQINFNKTQFKIYHEIANKYLDKLDDINTEDRKLYEELNALEKQLEG